MKPFCRIVTFEVLRCGVVVCVGPMGKELKRAYEAECRAHNIKDPPPFSFISDAVKAADDEDPGHPFKSLTIEKNYDYAIYMPKWEDDTFVHECFHAVNHVMMDHRIEDEETFAFHLEYLYSHVLGNRRKPR